MKLNKSNLRKALRAFTKGAFFFVVWGAVGVLQLSAQSALDLVQKMLAATQQVRGLSYMQYKWERIQGKDVFEKIEVKLTRGPLRVYVKQHPSQNEILFVTGENGGKALVNTGKYIPNISLDPLGSLMRKNQHHTIWSSGFDQLASIFSHLMTKYSSKAGQMLKYAGNITWQGKSFYQIDLENPQFGYTTYTVQAGENLITIARKFKLSEHMILEKNSATVSDYYGVKAGDKIQIPIDYAKKATILIDQKTFLPLSVTIYDDKGQYEKYDYYNLVLNPSFAENEFSPKFPGYRF